MPEDEEHTSGTGFWALLWSNFPLLGVLAVSVLAFLVVAHLDDAAGAAQARERSGLSRGTIVDRKGHRLAYSIQVKGKIERKYSLQDLEAPVGYRDPSGHWHGIEKEQSQFLDGATVRGDWRTFLLHLRGQSALGGRLRLTLDSALQKTADSALGQTKGAVVALDPRTGGVLALVSKPYCSPNSLSRARQYAACRGDPGQPLLDRAVQMLQPPGSAFKITTLSAAFDTHRFSLTSIFSGADAFGPSPYFDNVTYPSNVTRTDLTQLTLPQALAFSDNFSFAHIGLTLGAPTLLKYAHRYLIGKSIPFDYPVAPSSIANNDPHPTLSELAQSSFGAAVDHVTPMEMALIAETVANGGTMMAPHLIQDWEDQNGKVTRKYPAHALSHVMSRHAATDLTTAMIFVVDHGSGYRAQINGMAVAGKTGTAASGGYYPHAWFICFAPARHPVVAVAVLHEFSGEGFKFAAPIARKVLITALRERRFHVK